MTVATVDVVILTWNDAEQAEAAVASAFAQRDVAVQVIVVDNGSDPAAVVGDPRVQLVRSDRNLGVGGGRNLGVAAGSGPFVCFLDSDARLLPDTLGLLLAPMHADLTVGLTAPVYTDQRPEASAGVAPNFTDKVRRALNRTDVYSAAPGQGVGDSWDVDFAIGACQLFRREAFDTVGGLDASSTFGPEDVDFCLRLGQAGLRTVQVAAARCEHPPRRAFRGLATRRGLRHAVAVLRHLWRHRWASRRVPA